MGHQLTETEILAALGATLGWPTEMPAWALILALFIAFFFALPIVSQGSFNRVRYARS